MRLLLGTGGIIAISICIPLVCTILACVLFFVLKKGKVKNSDKLKEQYNTYHTQLTSDCSAMLSRLRSLGKYSKQYETYFFERNKQYADILEKKDKNVLRDIDNLDAVIKEKNKKQIKSIEEQCANDLENFRKCVYDFNEELNSLLKDDIDARDAIVNTKNKLHNIRNFYFENEVDLKPLKTTFGIIFGEADDKTKEYDKLVDHTRYAKAKDLLPTLEFLLDGVINVMYDLPQLTSLAFIALPNKVQALSEDYISMLNEGFTLDYLNVSSRITELTQKLNGIKERLTYMDIDGIREQLNDVQSQITDIQVKFNEEREAKVKFMESKESISGSSFDLEKRYYHLLNMLPQYQATYVLDEKYVSQIVALKLDIENISHLKHEIDSYVDTSNKQPYTIMFSNISTMRQAMQKVKNTMDAYEAYLSELKRDCQLVYDNLRRYYFSLKEAERLMRLSIDVENYTNVTAPRFKEVYENIAIIDEIITNTPVDLTKANLEFIPFSEKCDQLIAEVKEKTVQCQKAETAFVYANAYRVEFSDSRQYLRIAQRAFLEGDFERANSESLKVINMFNIEAANNKAN